MKLSTIILLTSTAALLSACGSSSSHRPTYSGKQESTEGVPGFVKGKKVSQHVKLGQSYTVDGETYVPRHQPDYVEEGKASWYGPGFHGGKTANGERFDANELTAAHRTLPLPSIVRVTMISTGKQVYVRVNDRGPFAHSRIIDLSRAAAERIGLLRAGVAKVRVEYMENESKRFTELLAQGRDPKSIDIASEVLDYTGSQNNQYARADVRVKSDDTTALVTDSSGDSSGSFWDRFSPVKKAEAAPQPRYPQEAMQSAPVSEVESSDLPSPEPTMSKVAEYQPKTPAPEARVANAGINAHDPNDANYSPFSMVDSVEPVAPAKKPIEVASVSPAKPVAPKVAATPNGATYVQLGAFQNQANAEKLRTQFSALGNLKIDKKLSASGSTLYHVRMGPYSDTVASDAALDKAVEAGAEARIVRE